MSRPEVARAAISLSALVSGAALFWAAATATTYDVSPGGGSNLIITARALVLGLAGAAAVILGLVLILRSRPDA